MLKYDRLLRLLEDNGYNSYKLKTANPPILAQATLTAIKKGTGGLNHMSIDRLCKTFNCQPNDLMEWVPDEEKKG